MSGKKTGGSYILIHWLPLRYVFVRLLYLNKTFNFKKKLHFFERRQVSSE